MYNAIQKLKNVTIAETSITLEQDNDCCDNNGLGQTITITTQDGGGGPYLVFSTERWAIDNVDEFADVLKGVLGLLTIEKTEKNKKL